MKAATLIGIVLIVIGLVSLTYQGITYTQREEAVDLGPVEIATEDKETILLPPLLGGLALVGGIVLVIVGSKK